eukprot:GHVN01077873.1.p2 GENE.GHVN01077873.1~~GHVN01077873.1.p2  ORF type:complete len:169 (+),score=24.06 GHVN01077873.1:961-1467(+)
MKNIGVTPMPKTKTHHRDYPVFSLSTNGLQVILSGGGGGKSYGIADVTEAVEVSESGDVTTLAKLNESGVLLSLSYSGGADLFCGGLLKECVILRIDAGNKRLEILGRTKVIEGEFVKNKNCKIVDRTAFSPNGNYVAVCGEDRGVRVFQVKDDRDEIVPEAGRLFGH